MFALSNANKKYFYQVNFQLFPWLFAHVHTTMLLQTIILVQLFNWLCYRNHTLLMGAAILFSLRLIWDMTEITLRLIWDNKFCHIMADNNRIFNPKGCLKKIMILAGKCHLTALSQWLSRIFPHQMLHCDWLIPIGIGLFCSEIHKLIMKSCMNTTKIRWKSQELCPHFRESLKVTHHFFYSWDSQLDNTENYISLQWWVQGGACTGYGPNFLHFMQFLGKSGKLVCWSPWGLVPPPMGHPGSTPGLTFFWDSQLEIIRKSI